VPQDYGVGFLRYQGAGGASAKPPWTIVSGWGQEAGFSAFDDENGIGYFTTHSNRQLGRWRKDEKAPPIDPASAFDPCYIPDVDPYRRSANCLDNTSWNAPLVLAPSNRNRLYAARDVVYRSDRAPIHEWAGLSAAEKSIPEKSCVSNDAPGITWAPTSLGRELDGNPVFSLAVAPNHEDHLVIATAPRYNRMNVFEPRDAGRTWERITYDLPETGYPMSLVFDPHDAAESTLYLALGGYGFSPRLEARQGTRSIPKVAGPRWRPSPRRLGREPPDRSGRSALPSSLRSHRPRRLPLRRWGRKLEGLERRSLPGRDEHGARALRPRAAAAAGDPRQRHLAADAAGAVRCGQAIYPSLSQ
jgi:hypothetical protein